MKEVGTTTGRRPDAESIERLERVDRLESYAGRLRLGRGGGGSCRAVRGGASLNKGTTA